MEKFLNLLLKIRNESKLNSNNFLKKKQALHDSSQSQTTTQAIENQTKAIQESSNALNKNFQK